MRVLQYCCLSLLLSFPSTAFGCNCDKREKFYFKVVRTDGCKCFYDGQTIQHCPQNGKRYILEHWYKSDKISPVNVLFKNRSDRVPGNFLTHILISLPSYWYADKIERDIYRKYHLNDMTENIRFNNMKFSKLNSLHRRAGRMAGYNIQDKRIRCRFLEEISSITFDSNNNVVEGPCLARDIDRSQHVVSKIMKSRKQGDMKMIDFPIELRNNQRYTYDFRIIDKSLDDFKHALHIDVSERFCK